MDDSHTKNYLYSTCLKAPSSRPRGPVDPCDNRIAKLCESDLQKHASRTNGSKSRGPVSKEGKLASSRNAIKHGVLSECIVLPGEREDSFHSLTADLFEEHRPVGSAEEDLVEMMAVARWRRMRIWSWKKPASTNRMVTEYRDDAPTPRAKVEDVAGRAFASLANGTRIFDLVSRYESCYDRRGTSVPTAVCSNCRTAECETNPTTLRRPHHRPIPAPRRRIARPHL